MSTVETWPETVKVGSEDRDRMRYRRVLDAGKARDVLALSGIAPEDHPASWERLLVLQAANADGVAPDLPEWIRELDAERPDWFDRECERLGVIRG